MNVQRIVPLVLAATAACAPSRPPPADAPTRDEPTPAVAPESRSWDVTPDLRVTELEPGVWLHVSWQVPDGGARFPSNGLLVRDGDGLLLVDTAWGEESTDALLGWIDETLGLPVTHAVATHWHDDRLGGIAALKRRGVTMVAHPLTRRIAAEHGIDPLPDVLRGLGEPGTDARLGPAEVFYPGPGHTLDNVMVWLPERRILVGGCAVRAAEFSSRGNVADADTLAWPGSIRRLVARYPEARVVVPGHGEPGGPELLLHTIEVVER